MPAHPRTDSSAASTRELLLSAAERLVLESGYDAVSVRAINTAAGMNPAAVHYHFGSKDALIAALLEQRLAPMWAQRLDEVTERHRAGWVPDIAGLVDTVLNPLVELADDPIGRLHLHLLARVVLSGKQLEWTSRWFGLRAWVTLLRAARPELSEREGARRWMLGFELILQEFGSPLAETPGSGRVPRIAVSTLREFVTAGLDAPVPEEEK